MKLEWPSRGVIGLATTTVLASFLALGCGRLGFDASQIDGQQDAAPLPTDAPPASNLVTRGLLSRYFVDEGDIASSVDTSHGDLDLAVVNATNLVPLELPTGRGLRFSEVGGPARACAAIAGSTVASLEGTTKATLEVVADIREGHDNRSRLAGVGIGTFWGFAIGYSSVDETLVFAMNNTVTVSGAWNFDASSLGRAVYTVVYDSELSDPTDRIRFYMDGFPVENQPAEEIGPSLPVTVGSGEFCIGNSPAATRAPDGDIFYAAIYTAALTQAEVAANSTELLISDD